MKVKEEERKLRLQKLELEKQQRMKKLQEREKERERVRLEKKKAAELKARERLEQEKMVGCPSVANLKFFQYIFKEYPTSRYKEIKLDEDYNILSITLSSKGTTDTLLKMYKCQSPIKFDTTQDLKSTLPSLEGYTDKLYIVGLKNNSLSIRGGFYLNNQKPFTINLK